VALLVKAFEFLSSFIKFNLGCLSFSYFLLKLFAFMANFNCELFYLQSQLFNFSFISSSVFFKSQIVFFFLASCKCPLLQLLLVPIHLKFELVHALICLEDHILDVIKSILLICDSLLEFFDFVL